MNWLCVITVLLTAVPLTAQQHRAHSLSELWTKWTFEPIVIPSLLLMALLYVRGLITSWHNAASRRSIRLWEAGCFGAGVLTLVLALLSPLDFLSDILFSAHMTQHELLMLVAAPLLVMAPSDCDPLGYASSLA